MNCLEHPNRDLWESRERWFDQVGNSYEGEGSYFVSDQACALILEAQIAFCAGAWVAVTILAIAVVDAQLREAELPGFMGNTKQLITAAEANSDLQRLRQRRNSLLHIDPDNPAITADQQLSNRVVLEEDAKQAVKLMFEAFYMSPGT